MQSKHANVPQVNATTLPTPEMVERAAGTPTTQTERYIRLAFQKKLSKMRKLRLENKIDSSTPSLDFTFIDDYVPGKDVYRADPDSFEGCAAPCKANMGNRIGCEWPRECKCLEYAAVNEDLLRREDPKRYYGYQEKRQNGEYIDIRNLPKRFPYHAPKTEHMPQTLVQFYREERHPIYECNANCRCGPACKSRVVQRGRRVPLTIFKTPNQGWGVYCDEDLVQGEFIDTYLGEIITNEEADSREQAGSKDKQSYLYSLDKFVDDVDGLTQETCYVVDGQDMGGATRFINHSCEPNCRQYTVSYNKNDPRIYDLAFFAIEDIPAGVELTFDYQDKDEVEEDVAVRRREAALRDPANAGKQPCNCGARKCRGFLWE
jgi:histone-lysine N-methyltransferase SUV39H